MKESDFKLRLEEIRHADDEGMVSCRRELAALLVRDFPDRGRAWCELGMALYPMSLYDLALRSFRRALRLCPSKEHYLIHGQIGHLYFQKGEFRRAEACYRQALEGVPNGAMHYIFLGALLAQSGRLEEAEAVHRKATRVREGCVDEAYLNLGLVLRAQQRYKE